MNKNKNTPNKKNKKIALFIGKFQPFHKGHLYVLKDILKKFQSVYILIGSANKKGEFSNPFSAKQRKNIIKTYLKKFLNTKNTKKIKFFFLDDHPSDLAWINKLKKRFSSNKYIICTTNRLVLKLALNSKYEIYKPKLYKRKLIQAKKIRKILFSKNSINQKELLKYLPLDVINLIKKYLKKIKVKKS